MTDVNVVTFFIVACLSMRSAFLFLSVCFLCFTAVSAVDLTMKIYADSICSSFVRERSFAQNQCYTLSYDALEPSQSPCRVSSECFDETFQDDMDSCPNQTAFNATTILTGVTGYRVHENPTGPCGTRRGDQVTEYTFGKCIPSLLYPNCYLRVELGNTEDDDDDTANSAPSLMGSVAMVVVMLTVCLSLWA